jgi:hypothetical protein
MRRAAAVTAGAGVVVALTVGCTGSSAPGPATKASANTVPTSPARVGGVIGVIDQARVVAVCENVRQAATALDGGLGDATVGRFLVAAEKLLDGVPRVDTAVALASRMRADRERGDRAAAVSAGNAWCQDNE